MTAPRTLLFALLVVAVLGCTRNETRREIGRAAPPPNDRELAQRPLAAPMPPRPPVEPPVSPPKPEAVAGIVPPLPSGNDLPPAPVTQADATEFISTAETEDRKRLRERLQERRQKKEEEKKGKAELPSPFAPKDGPKETAPPATGAPGADVAAVRKLLDAFKAKFGEVTDFEARLVKREVVGGKDTPQDEILYRYRTKPMSVYMKTLSKAGHGREVMYVAGMGNKMHVVTGDGDNALVGAGYKTELDIDSKMASGRSRHKISDAGFTRSLTGLTKAVEAAEKGMPITLKALGKVTRKEYATPLEGVEIVLKPGQDASMPKGGRREIYFDAKPDSASFMLPVLAIAYEADARGEREVEYYCFDRFKLPANLTDADWNPANMGKRR